MEGAKFYHPTSIFLSSCCSEGKTSYTTLGHQLGVSLRELHRCLALALLSEKYPSALVRTLKTIELLVENVNYSKLQPGLLSKLVTHVKYFMRYKGEAPLVCFSVFDYISFFSEVFCKAEKESSRGVSGATLYQEAS